MAFATAEQVAIRLGRDLSSAEEDMVELALGQITELIAEIAGSDADDISPVPAYYELLCIEKALAVGSNPYQLAATTERLGEYEYSETFRGGRDVGSVLFLTDEEQRQVRRIANNAVSGSVRTRSLVHDTLVTDE